MLENPMKRDIVKIVYQEGRNPRIILVRPDSSIRIDVKSAFEAARVMMGILKNDPGIPIEIR